MNRMIDIVGQKFTYLLVVEYAGRVNGRNMYSCKCDCGKTKLIGRSNLRSGNTKSCGCKKEEMQIAKRTKHGMHDRRVYRIWEAMKSRCGNANNSAFRIYGGRGISVCERWNSFQNFFEDMGDCPDGYQIDRIDNNGGYEPGNCRWVSPSENSRNKSTNLFITYRGETKCLADWSAETGILDETIRYRFHRGWPVEKIFSVRPARKTKEKQEI